MSIEVYANGRSIACKAADGKSVAAFPDTCLSPPQPPAGPVPIPYPNTSKAADTVNGSKTVMISGQEIMLKDRSTFKTSTGDEAATKSLGMGVVTHTIRGEASFSSWSMDVKVEDCNVDRHLDMTVHNEQCLPAQTAGMVYLDKAAADVSPGCNNAGSAALIGLVLADKSAVVAGGWFQPSEGTGTAFLGSNAVSASAITPTGKFKSFAKHKVGPKGRKSAVSCNGSRFKYKRSRRPKQGHAEAKMIESIFNKAGGTPSGTLYLKVDGRPICPDCEALLKCASEHIKIIRCDSKFEHE